MFGTIMSCRWLRRINFAVAVVPTIQCFVSRREIKTWQSVKFMRHGGTMFFFLFISELMISKQFL